MNARIPLAVILLAAATSAASDPQPNGDTKKWSVSLHEAAFPEFSGVRHSEIAQGSDGWAESWTVLTPHVGLGYSLNDRWSVETSIQKGPRSSFNSRESGSDTLPQIEFKSSFASVVAAREFKLEDGWSWSPKFGIALSSLEYREEMDTTRWKARTEITIQPVATLESASRSRIVGRSRPTTPGTSPTRTRSTTRSSSAFGLGSDLRAVPVARGCVDSAFRGRCGQPSPSAPQRNWNARVHI